MSRWPTILLSLLAIGAIVFLAIYEPLTRSTRERELVLRDGRVMALSPSKIKQVRIVSGDSDLRLRRQGNGWQLGEKSKDRADTAMMERLLQTFAEMEFIDRISGREVPDEKSLNPYGLGNPKRKIELDGERRTTLFLGKEGAGKNTLYVSTSDSSDVFLVSDQVLRQAFRPASDFRDRRLTNLAPNQIDRVVLRRTGGEIDLIRDARGWQIVKPLHVGADDAKVNEFLAGVLGLRISSYVADDSGDLSAYGLVEGVNEITFYADGSDRPQTLRLGTNPEGILHGQFTARDSIYRMPPEAEAYLGISPGLLRDHRLLPLNLDVVDRIRIQSGERNFVIQRTVNSWEVVDPDGTAPASDAAIRAVIDALTTTRVIDYTSATGEKITEAGLDTPHCVIKFFSVLSENTPEAPAGEQLVAAIAFGKSVDGRVTVRADEAPELTVVDDSILAVIPTEPAGWRAPR